MDKILFYQIAEDRRGKRSSGIRPKLGSSGSRIAEDDLCGLLAACQEFSVVIHKNNPEGALGGFSDDAPNGQALRSHELAVNFVYFFQNFLS